MILRHLAADSAHGIQMARFIWCWHHYSKSVNLPTPWSRFQGFSDISMSAASTNSGEVKRRVAHN